MVLFALKFILTKAKRNLKLEMEITDDYFGEFHLGGLPLDHYFLNIILPPDTNCTLNQLHEDCVKCDYHKKEGISIPTHVKTLSTHYKYQIDCPTKGVICNLNDYTSYGEYGVYNVTVSENECVVNTLSEPVNIYWPLLTVPAIYALFYLLVYILIYIIKLFKPKNENTTENAPKKERVRSIDTFRGIAIAIMMFVNFGGGGYSILEHATWDGLHLADLAFPWFMWIMGFCIPISVSSSIKRNVPKKDIMFQVFKRSLKLFAIGLFLSSGVEIKTMRIFSVLQRFGICYFVVTTVCLYTMKENSSDKPGRFSDFKRLSLGWIYIILIQFIYLIIIFTVSKNGCPRGYFGPGGYHEYEKHINCTGGATGFLDTEIFGEDHIYQDPTSNKPYNSGPFEPEGMIGCFTSILQVFIGAHAGIILLVYKSHMERLFRWLSWSVATGLIGLALCGFFDDDIAVIPVNKNLWSISFVMVTSSLAFAVLSLSYFLIDIKKYWSGKPFLYAGMNALIMFVGHEMTGDHFPIRWVLTETIRQNRNSHTWCLIYDLWSTQFWMWVAFYLHKIGYFFSV